MMSLAQRLAIVLALFLSPSTLLVAGDHPTGPTPASLDTDESRMRELERLRNYNLHLERMLVGQEASITRLEHQIESLAVTRLEILPLMARMVDSLARFVALDLPFRLDERRERVAELAALIDSPQVSSAEKFRRILETYRMEMDEGRRIDAYRGRLELEGRERTVDFLRLGRVLLLYRTLDGKEAGIWDQDGRRWTGLADRDRAGLEEAFRVARKQTAPNLLRLPIPAPEWGDEGPP